MNIPFNIVRKKGGIAYDVEVLVGPSGKAGVVFTNVHAMNLVKRYGDEDLVPAGYLAFTKGELIDLTPEEQERFQDEIREMQASLRKARAELARPVS